MENLNRIIKFRAWDKENYQFMEGNLYLDMKGIINEYKSGRTIELDNVEIMQYTGLKDKNGKEVYEGDIITLSEDDYYDERTGKIEIRRGNTVLINMKTNNAYETWDDGSHEWSSLENKYDFEIIGNIYENPEIIKI